MAISSGNSSGDGERQRCSQRGGSSGRSHSSGIDSLIGNPEASFSDATIEASEKLNMFSQFVREWLASEPVNVLRFEKSVSDSPVTGHATFGRMRALVMMSCTCAHSQRSMCALHCDSPCLADLVFIISEAVHPVFNDGFMCFANIFVDCRCDDFRTMFGFTKLSWFQKSTTYILTTVTIMITHQYH